MELIEVIFNGEKKSLTFIFKNGNKFGYVGKRAIKVMKKINEKHEQTNSKSEQANIRSNMQFDL